MSENLEISLDISSDSDVMIMTNNYKKDCKVRAFCDCDCTRAYKGSLM